jgi:hypothetical protein
LPVFVNPELHAAFLRRPPNRCNEIRRSESLEGRTLSRPKIMGRHHARSASRQRCRRGGGRPSRLNLVHGAAVRAGIRHPAGRRQRPRQELLAAPAFHPERTDPSGGLIALRRRSGGRIHLAFPHHLQRPDLSFRYVALRFFPDNVIAFSHR